MEVAGQQPLLVEGGFAMTTATTTAAVQNEQGGVSPDGRLQSGLVYGQSSTELVWGSVAPSLDAYGHHINRLADLPGCGLVT